MGIYEKEWKKNNEYELNEDYILKILNKFNVKQYSVVKNPYGGCNLHIEINIYKYHIEMDYDRCLVNIKRGKRINFSQKSSREFMPIKKTIEEDLIWYDAIKWVVKDSNVI